MKRIFIAILLAGLTASITSRAAETNKPVVWCGLDYSKVKMIGTQDFRQPEEIFPRMLEDWNSLFITEMLPQLEKTFPSVKTDLKAVEDRNAKANASQIDREDGSTDEMVTPSSVTSADIARIVKSYDLKNKEGTGLVFIMDRLVKAQQMGCLYVVFFDVSSRTVLHSERVVAKAGGFGFRNYWFSPVKTAVKQLPKISKEAKLN